MALLLFVVEAELKKRSLSPFWRQQKKTLYNRMVRERKNNWSLSFEEIVTFTYIYTLKGVA